MNIDLAALRALEREREIPFETILAAIETALLTAYRHTEGAETHARVEIDRKTGVVLDIDGRSTEIPYADLGPGKVQIEFKRLDEAVFPDEPDDGEPEEDEDEDDDEDGEGEDR